jgi:hypothetical protein
MFAAGGGMDEILKSVKGSVLENIFDEIKDSSKDQS